MKKIYFPMIVTMIIVASCQMKTKSVPFDPVTAKTEVTKTLDSMEMALKSKDVKTFLSFYKEDGLYCGSDPTELWNKEDYAKMITQMMTDTANSFTMNVSKMEIRFNKDGNSANVLRQFVTNWSKPVEVRSTAHLVKTDKRWIVDFESVAFIPTNNDVPKIITALKK